MSTLPTKKHAGPGTASDQPTVVEPSFAERTRTLVHLGRIGSLSTLSRKQHGFPFGSVMVGCRGVFMFCSSPSAAILRQFEHV